MFLAHARQPIIGVTQWRLYIKAMWLIGLMAFPKALVFLFSSDIKPKVYEAIWCLDELTPHSFVSIVWFHMQSKCMFIMLATC